MDRGMMGVLTVDAAGQQDAWDWEVLQPDPMSSSRMSHDADDQETKQELVTAPPSSSDGADVHDETPEDETPAEPSKEEEEEKEEATPEVTGDKEEKEKTALQSLDDDTDKKPDDDQEEEEEEEEGDAIKKQDNDRGATRPECVVFSVGKLKVNGIGALCSFGVAAATVCIFLIGGRMQHRQQQQNKIQLQFYGDDKRIQQVVQQTSRLNQTMSSVMGGGLGGGSTRANISFGGYYDGL